MTKLKMTAMNVGPLGGAKNLLVAFAPGNVETPTTSAIIEHPKHGIVLWDTGVNDAVADPDRANDYWGSGLPAAFGAERLKREDIVDAQVKRLGISLEEVRYVVYSHLHLDHAGGMSYFPNAIHVVQRDEVRYALWPDAWTRPMYCQNDFRDIRKLNFLEIDGDFDLFGDGSLKLITAPGHSPGQQVLVVDLPNRGRICLAADTGHQRDGFENMVPMPWDWSISAMSMTRMRMKQLERSGVPLFFCHDMDDFSKLPQGGKFWD
ncbi:N-acyl homoserine lactonase family protein [Bradyrhizobium erythrophlei]|uniref:Metallo-beta-lactamase superfamily protein n=1 Tax=Bradyrhizobium erythrophlei TaxID=1437360 RepID=A0A1H4X322_9BRAD|nr:N-acyl homoserine lactonase family protein [Bradyrhizobium erythrophlei]SEC99231.1 Metallo-beta-lactamase superfamily protein [Bradyrhizobium erythrophlei]